MEDKIVDLLKRLKKVNGVYAKATEEQRGRLLTACEKIIKELVALTGKDYSFFEGLVIGGLVIGGNEFLEGVCGAGIVNDCQAGEVIFG